MRAAISSEMLLPDLAGTEGILQCIFDVHPSAWLALSLLFIIMRFLRLFSTPEKPKVYLNRKPDTCKSNMQQIIDATPILDEVYRPPWLWGRSGHLQTAAYGLLGHSSLRRTGRREFVKLADGTTVTFDVFEPLAKNSSGLDVTLCLTPGIANSAESNYIRTCVHNAQEAGYRCAVLNHLGALVGVQLTSPRIFSYGGTEELTSMMNWLAANYSATRFFCIGFSMGANITTRFLIESTEEMRSRILMGLSVGQGYSATTSAPMYHDWENGRRAYNYVITENMKRLLRRNYEQAVAPYVAKGLVDEQRLWSATSIILFDELYNRRVGGYESVDALYAAASCLPLLERLKVPMIFLNTHDDPIVPKILWEPVKELSQNREEMAFISTKHGGHLGFLEGPSLSPLSVTWLDRLIVQLADSACKVYHIGSSTK